MSALSPLIHTLLVLGDNLDRVTDEMPSSVCEDQRLTLAGLARACQLTAEQLKAQEAERERKLSEAA